MLGDSAVLGTAPGGGGGGGSSGDAAAAAAALAEAAAAAARAHDSAADAAAGGVGGGGASNSGDEGDRSFGGNRWPRQETLALLKIRSDMDVAFRDASVKGPLWEEVSRKLAELGYHRNAKKCKEKFENVYKYHKRTKEGRSGKSDGKTYRFFDQLQALENNPATIQYPKPPQPQTALPAIQSPAISKPPQQQTAPPATTPVSVMATTPASSLPLPLAPPLANNNTIPTTTNITVPSINLTVPNSYPASLLFPPSTTNPPPHTTITPPSFLNIPTGLLSDDSSTFSTSSDETETTMEAGSRKRKRKWKDFFERLMKEVTEKQEELQKRFLEAIERREQERAAREEAWKAQEMQRINREREILAQERSIAAAKDAAVMAFLQKVAEQQNASPTSNNNTPPQPQETTPAPVPAPPFVPASTPVPLSVPVQTPAPPVVQQIAAPVPQPVPQSLAPQEVRQQHQHQHQHPQVVVQEQQQVTNLEMVKVDNGERVMLPATSSRWPKAEVEALIKLRTSLDTKYQDSGPKGPLWEEISALMRKIGYNRNAKRCKEKWENINKYFKKVKESNKKRPEDAKTCPYFHQLDALYREKSKMMESSLMKPAESAAATMMAPLMVRPEQQWPPQPAAPEVTMGDAGSDRRNSEEEEDYDEDNDYDDKDAGDDEDEDDEGTGKYEVVASKPAPR